MSSLGLIVSCVEITTSNQDLLYQVHQGSGTGRILGCLCYWIGFLHAKWTGRDFGIDDRIAASVPPPIATFLLTAECSASAIVAQQRRCRANTLQLCDHLPAEIYPELRKQLPGIALVQVVHVVGPESVEYATSAARYVDALLLDSATRNSRSRSWVAQAEFMIGGSADGFAIPYQYRSFSLAGFMPGMSTRRSRPFNQLVSICAAGFAQTTQSMTSSLKPSSPPSTKADSE
jgi:hypothetical protein